jgi:hypothetical protein
MSSWRRGLGRARGGGRMRGGLWAARSDEFVATGFRAPTQAPDAEQECLGDYGSTRVNVNRVLTNQST